MKSLCITYHMHRNYPRKEVAETCITLPMKDEIARDILERGEKSRYLDPTKISDGMTPVSGGVVYEALCRLSEIQGYRYESFCTAEEVCLNGEMEVPLTERFLVRFSDDSRSHTQSFQLVELTLDELQAVSIEVTHILKCRAAGKAAMANAHYNSPFRISDVAEETVDQLMVHMYDGQLEALVSATKTIMKRTWGVEWLVDEEDYD